MARTYKKDYVTKVATNYHMQFRIADWMRELPAFKNIPRSQVVFRKTLKTSDYETAKKRSEEVRIKMQVHEKPFNADDIVRDLTEEKISA